MAHALLTSVKEAVTTDRQYVENHWQEGMRATWHAAFEKDNHYTLFRKEDAPAWIIFTCVFAFLITADNMILNRHAKAMTMLRATVFTCFWICCAMGFAFWVREYFGPTQQFQWLSGYMLEWMLSFDNLFVFHMIFQVYGTPDHLKHRPLYLGIIGAVIFRLAFIFIGEYLMHAMYFVHFIFGGFLVYTGVQTMIADEEDDDPSQQPIVQWLQNKVPFVSAYDSTGAFFVRVPVDAEGKLVQDYASLAPAATESTALVQDASDEEGEKTAKYGAMDFEAAMQASPQTRYEWRATMLFLVVCCLEVSDVIFAVDSVSAIVAQVPDLFLAYTSAVFAMLGLRATFFIIDALVQLFSLLKYGVGAVLIFIGIKLIGSNYYHVPASVVCFVLVSCVGSSMIASVLQDRWEKLAEAKAVAAKLQAIGASPMIKHASIA